MTWRDAARPIISNVIAENKGKSEPELRKALREAFPWGPREMHPYKIWLDEIRVQLEKKPVVHQSMIPGVATAKQIESCEGQGELF